MSESSSELSKMVYCQKHHCEAEGLESQPLPGLTGEKIFQNICKKAWEEWLGHQTMLINEYRLSLVDPKARSFLATEREKFLFGTGSEKPSGFTPK